MDGWTTKEEFTDANILFLIHPTFTLYTVPVYHHWLKLWGVWHEILFISTENVFVFSQQIDLKREQN